MAPRVGSELPQALGIFAQGAALWQAWGCDVPAGLRSPAPTGRGFATPGLVSPDPIPQRPATLCLVDGTFELFRAFYGAPSRKAASGMEVGAARALARSLRALVHSGEFTHCAVAFDTVIESFRNDLFAGYKTGVGVEPSLLSQFPLAEQVTRALGFGVLSMIEFEADDGLATLASEHRGRPELTTIVIASPDKDLRQCVRSRDQDGGCPVLTWDRIRDVRYDVPGVRQKMGITPESVPDFLALVGDTADGIPGVPRWGARSAAQVLAHYLHVESIPLDGAQWQVSVRGAKGLAEQLRAHQQAAMLYKQLATLRTDVPHGLSFEQLERPEIDRATFDHAEQLIDAALPLA